MAAESTELQEKRKATMSEVEREAMYERWRSKSMRELKNAAAARQIEVEDTRHLAAQDKEEVRSSIAEKIIEFIRFE